MVPVTPLDSLRRHARVHWRDDRVQTDRVRFGPVETIFRLK